MEEKWNYNELVDIQSLMEKTMYSHEQKLKIYDLFNRINNTNKQPTSCGKCVVSVLNGLRHTYNEERKRREE